MNFQKIKKNAPLYNSNIIMGIEFYIKAHHFVLKNNLIRHLFVSGFIFLLLFSIGIKGLVSGIESVEPAITQWLISNFKVYLNLSLEDVKLAIYAAFWIIKKAIESNKDSIFTSFFLIIGSPYFSMISRKVDEIVSQKLQPFSFRRWIKEIIRGLKISITNSIKQFFSIIIITLFSFIPFVGIIAPLLTFIIQAYYNGILMADYTLEQQDYDVNQSRQFYSNNKPVMFSIGLGFMFLLLIPVIGWFLAPTYALVASSLYFLKLKKTI